MKENSIKPLNASMVQYQKCHGQLWFSDLTQYVLELENLQETRNSKEQNDSDNDLQHGNEGSLIKTEVSKITCGIVSCHLFYAA